MSDLAHKLRQLGFEGNALTLALASHACRRDLNALPPAGRLLWHYGPEVVCVEVPTTTTLFRVRTAGLLTEDADDRMQST